MEFKELYLSGYVEYVNDRIAFVTPVFKGDAKNLYIQALSLTNQIEWELLPTEYYSNVVAIESGERIVPHSSIIYGFKWDDNLFFGEGQKMAEYLSDSFLPFTQNGKELAHSFLFDWPVIEDTNSMLTKDVVWNLCLAVVGKESKRFRNIFYEIFTVIDYKDKVLYVSCDNESVTSVFETKFKSEIIESLRNDIPEFNLTVQGSNNDHSSLTLDFVELKSKVIGSPSLSIRETGINPYYGVDDFIIGEYNADAYYRGLKFTESGTPKIILLQGAAGLGKTHFVNFIAKKIGEQQKNKRVGFYTAFLKGLNESTTDFDQFAKNASQNDYIILDDAHNIGDGLVFERLIDFMKHWRDSNISVILTSRDQDKSERVLRSVKEAEYVELLPPSESDKRHFIESKWNDFRVDFPNQRDFALSDINELKNIADIEKALMKHYLIRGLGASDINEYFKHKHTVQFQTTLFSCVSDYLVANSLIKSNSSSVFQYNHAISQFILELFQGSSDKGTYDYVQYWDSLYSFSQIKFRVIHDATFKSAIREIFQQLIKNL